MKILTARLPKKASKNNITYSSAKLKQILDETFGMWRHKRLNPITYQRKIRKTYATARKRKV